MLSKEEVEAYCKEYYVPIYKFCMSKLSNKEDTEDATQETFVVFSKKGHLLEKEYVKPWLFTVAYNKVLKIYRKRTLANDKECIYDEELVEASRKFTTFEEDVVSCYGEKYINEVYSRLSNSEKEIFDLYSDGNLKTGQISKMLGIETNACSMRKKRLKDRCREILKELIFY